jgi:hypothetical protein
MIRKNGAGGQCVVPRHINYPVIVSLLSRVHSCRKLWYAWRKAGSERHDGRESQCKKHLDDD